jgi:hypothetical protein
MKIFCIIHQVNFNVLLVEYVELCRCNMNRILRALDDGCFVQATREMCLKDKDDRKKKGARPLLDIYSNIFSIFATLLIYTIL